MRRIFSVFVFLSLTATASAETTGRGGLFFGQKSMSSDWGDLDSHSAWGINLDVRDTSWPVWITAGYVNSREEETVVTSVSPFAATEITAETTELRLGVTKDFQPLSRARLSIGAGPAYIKGELDSGAPVFGSDADSTVGYWAGAGVVFNLNFISLGASYQYSKGEIDLFGESIDAGGSSVAFSVGFGW